MQIHVLSTEKPSRLIKSQDNDFVYLNTNAPNWFENNLKTTKQNIYITSDEEIKEGDRCIDTKRNIIFQSKRNEIGTSKKIPIIICTYEGCYIKKDCKKIILTTDQDLIKDGVQSIDDEFLEWFVKNPSCEFVKVEQEMFKLVHNPNYVNHTSEGDGIYLTPKSENLQYGETLIEDNVIDYKIIIPKEEPKQEVTLDTIENRIIECLNEADAKLDSNDFDRLAESIIDYIDEIKRSKNC
jgi:hypothetical protein